MKLNTSFPITCTLGTEAISEGDNYTHLGVTCNKYSKLGTVIDGACRSLRGNFMALINIGFHPNGLHPCSSFKIYKSIVLPRAMYGCELWSSYTHAQLSKYTGQLFYLVSCMVVSYGRATPMLNFQNMQVNCFTSCHVWL